MKVCGNDYYLGAYIERCGSSLIRMEDLFSQRQDTFTPKDLSRAEEKTDNVRADSFQISDQSVEIDPAHVMSHEEMVTGIFYSRYIGNVGQERSDDLFQAKGTQQWQVFSEQLYNSGFFDGMSDEEVLETEQLLIQITSSADTFHSCRSLSASPLQRVSDLIYADRERIDWDTYKDMSGEEWEFLLESATAALQLFNEKYVPEEQQTAFGELIDQFHAYNSSLLKGYQSPNEWRVRYEALQDGQDTEEISDAEEDTVSSGEVQIRIPSAAETDKTAYLEELKAYFGRLAVLQGTDASGAVLMPSGQKADEEESRTEEPEVQEDSAYREELKAYFAQFSSSGDGRIAPLMDQLSSEDCALKEQFQSGGHRSYLTQDEGWERCVRQIQGYWEKMDQFLT